MGYLGRLVDLVFQQFLGYTLFDFPGFKLFRSTYYRLRFNLKGEVDVGHNCKIVPLHPIKKSKLKIGKNFVLGYSSFVDTTDNITIGKNVIISTESIVYTHDHNFKNQSMRANDVHKDVISSPLVIEDEVWIAARSIILPSVKKIGRGAIIGAGAVVTKDVLPNTIVAGNPAKVVGKRNLK